MITSAALYFVGIVAWTRVRPNFASPCLDCHLKHGRAQCCDTYDDGECGCEVGWDRFSVKNDCFRSGGMLCEFDATVRGVYGQDRSTKYSNIGLTCMPRPENNPGQEDKCDRKDYERILLELVHDCVAVNHEQCNAWERACVDEPIQCTFGECVVLRALVLLVLSCGSVHS